VRSARDERERAQTEADGRLVRVVRGLPLADLRQLFAEMDGVLTPSCPEAQADGVPCPDAGSACDGCGRARSILEVVRGRIGRP